MKKKNESKETKQLKEKICDALANKKITDVDEAIKFLENKAGIQVDLNHGFKWNITDAANDLNDWIKDDKALIDYANEQKEAIGEDED